MQTRGGEGYVLLQHGSRAGEALVEQERILSMIQTRMDGNVVKAAYLQAGLPSLGEVVAEMSAEGLESIIVMPMFLLSGSHVTQSVPDVVEKAKGEFPTLRIRVTAHIGPDPKLVDIIEGRMREEAASGKRA